jgi:glycosyltransferase involved in cell wall biosynthesis
MKIAAVAIVKNEADIIELFIKINSRWCDHMYVVDGSSDDGTFEILKVLEKSFNLTLLTENGLHYFQGQMMTKLVNEIALSTTYDFIALLDADEFISTPRNQLEQVLESLDSPSAIGLLPWQTFVPRNAAWDDLSSTLYDSFCMRAKEPVPDYKIILPASIAKTCTIKEGNHNIAGNPHIQRLILPIAIQHVPVRSSRQLIQKTILISHRQSIKPKLESPIEGFHVTMMIKKIRELDYWIDEENLKSIAMNYASFTSTTENEYNTEIKIGLSSDKITLKELRRDATVKIFDKFLIKLCAEYNQYIYKR